jgi:hypothetical protein
MTSMIKVTAMQATLADLIAITGGLGTAAFALVDACKLFWGGVSNCGFTRIMAVVTSLVPSGDDSPAWHASIRPTLRANWLNGTALADQKAIAKTLIKLRMNPTTAPAMAARTGVDPAALTTIAGKIHLGTTLTADEAAIFGRFDLIVTSMLDEGYQRADQIYRNSAKALSVLVAVVLAIAGVLAITPIGQVAAMLPQAILMGVIAAPLAPVSKDVASALAAGAKLAQALGK